METLQRWNQDTFGNVNRKIQDIQESINVEMSNGADLKKIIRLEKEMDMLLENEKIMWKQRSRI